MTRSLTASEAGAAQALRSLTDKGWSREDLANQVVIDDIRAITVQTVHKFFACRPVDRKYFVGICRALDLDWETVSRSSASTVASLRQHDSDRSIEDCDRSQYSKAIENAHQRVWVYQTWLPAIEIDADQICRSSATDIRLLLLSFKEFSPIYARLQGRRMSVSRAQNNSASSVRAFVNCGKTDCVRFNYGHHPGWIAVVDSLVFWGPTPVNIDSHSVEFLFHKHPASSDKGKFWIGQFEIIWSEHSHTFDEELQYNKELLDLM